MVNIKPVRFFKRGNNYQLYFYTLKGERRRVSAGNDYSHAQMLAARFTEFLLNGKDPETEIRRIQKKESARAITIKGLYSKFMERHGKYRSQAMQESYKYSFNNICRCKELADSELSSISKSLVLDYMQLRIHKEGVTNATVNREAAMLKVMLSRAAEWDLIEQNPLQGLRLLPEAEKFKVEFTPKEAGMLLSELPEPVANIVEFLIYSGFRKENVLGLRIESITFYDLITKGDAELVVKGNRREKFPLCEPAVEVLKRVIGDRRSGFVFLNASKNNRYSDIHHTFNRAVKKLGFKVGDKKLRIHDLRHVYGTWLHRGGVPLDHLRELMGHRNRSTTDRYATLNRTDSGKHLAAMPRIIKLGKKNSLDLPIIKAN
ncbi:tyrosine-type recombinase/integrase [candidate division KSB1 bacterium]